MIGNSSSGIIEAPSFRIPTVNIGDRQKEELCVLQLSTVKIPKKKFLIYQKSIK